MSVTKHGFRNHVIFKRPIKIYGNTVSNQELRFRDLPVSERQRIREDFYNAIGWDYWKFSMKMNGNIHLEPHEIEFVQKYFENYNH